MSPASGSPARRARLLATRLAAACSSDAHPEPWPAATGVPLAETFRLSVDFPGPGPVRALFVARLDELGIRTVRHEVRWRSVEPTPGVFESGATDDALAATEGAGVERPAKLGYANPWASAAGADAANPRWVTVSGWPTLSLTKAEQAECLVRAHLVLWARGVSLGCVDPLADAAPAGDHRAPSEPTFGLCTWDPTPADAADGTARPRRPAPTCSRVPRSRRRPGSTTRSGSGRRRLRSGFRSAPTDVSSPARPQRPLRASSIFEITSRFCGRSNATSVRGSPNFVEA